MTGALRATLAVGAVVAAVAAVGLGAWVLGMEDRFLYFPSKTLSAAPERFGLRAEEIALTAGDGVRLHGWWIRGDGRRAILFFHGNAGNIADRLERAAELNRRLGADVFLVDYRGYGRSEGSPSEAGLYRDARAVHAAAFERGFPEQRLVAFGESLGSAVAADLASSRPCGALILETPFLSVPDMARVHYPFVPRFLVRSRFDNAEKIPAIEIPKLFLVAERDEVVPAAQGLRLFELAREPKTLYVIPGAGHNDTYLAGGEAYWESVRRFLETASDPAP